APPPMPRAADVRADHPVGGALQIVVPVAGVVSEEACSLASQAGELIYVPVLQQFRFQAASELGRVWLPVEHVDNRREVLARAGKQVVILHLPAVADRQMMEQPNPLGNVAEPAIAGTATARN